MKKKNEIKTKRIGLAWHYGLLPLVWLLWYFLYPETIGNVEAESFFVWTPDYADEKLSRGVAGILSLASGFLSQFFRWREGGVLIQTLLFGCMLGLSDLLSCRLRCRECAWFSWVVAGLFLCLQLHWGRLEPALGVVAGYGLLVSCVVLLPERVRLAIPLRLLRIVNPKIHYGLSAAIILSAFALFALSPSAHNREKRIAVKQAATATAWNAVLRYITPDEALYDPMLQRYALLAFAGMDKLAENLPKFRLSSPDSFYFYLPSTPDERYFNALFYRSLGLYNEYVHQLSEVAIQYADGMTFGCLRQIADGYLKMGNDRLAKKYLTLLGRSTCHAGWVRSRLALLDALKEKPVDTPEKSYFDIFIGSYPFLHEMELLLKENPHNSRVKMYFDAASAL